MTMSSSLLAAAEEPMVMDHNQTHPDQQNQRHQPQPHHSPAVSATPAAAAAAAAATTTSETKTITKPDVKPRTEAKDDILRPPFAGTTATAPVPVTLLPVVAKEPQQDDSAAASTKNPFPGVLVPSGAAPAVGGSSSSSYPSPSTTSLSAITAPAAPVVSSSSVAATGPSTHSAPQPTGVALAPSPSTSASPMAVATWQIVQQALMGGNLADAAAALTAAAAAATSNSNTNTAPAPSSSAAAAAALNPLLVAGLAAAAAQQQHQVQQQQQRLPLPALAPVLSQPARTTSTLLPYPTPPTTQVVQPPVTTSSSSATIPSSLLQQPPNMAVPTDASASSHVPLPSPSLPQHQHHHSQQQQQPSHHYHHHHHHHNHPQQQQSQPYAGERKDLKRTSAAAQLGDPSASGTKHAKLHPGTSSSNSSSILPTASAVTSSSAAATAAAAALLGGSTMSSASSSTSLNHHHHPHATTSSSSTNDNHHHNNHNSNSLSCLDMPPPKPKSESELARMTPAERRRYDRNWREQQRSYRISQQIKELRDVLSESQVPFKPNKFSILISVTDYIKQLQSRAIMLDAEHHKLVTTLSQATNTSSTTGIQPNPTNSSLAGMGMIGLDGTTVSGEEESSVGATTAASATVSDQDLLLVQGIDYKSIFAGCPFAIGVASLDGRVLACNEALETLLGCEPREMVEQSLFLFIRNHQEIFEAMADLLKRSSLATEAGELTPPPEQLLFWCGNIVSQSSQKLFGITGTLVGKYIASLARIWDWTFRSKDAL